MTIQTIDMTPGGATRPVDAATRGSPGEGSASADAGLDPLTIGRGAASGLVAGLGASWAMDRFQVVVQPVLRAAGGGNSSGAPATVIAAERTSRLFAGNALAGDYREAGGSAVHYTIGMLTAGLYGAVAERRPGVTRWRGAAFGIASATLVDQLLVPLAGLARPPWRYSLATHLYGYVSHIVFGMVTEAIRRQLRATGSQSEAAGARDPSSITLEDAAVPLMLGMANGQRTMTPPAVVSIAAAGGALDLSRTRLSFLSSPWTAAVLTAGAIGEYVVDVNPATPARTALPGLAARLAGGALAGAATAREEKRAFASWVGAAGALAGTLASYAVRMRLARALRRDRPAGIAEDLLSLAGTGAITAFAAMRVRRRRQTSSA